jgi:hypothetical protein
MKCDIDHTLRVHAKSRAATRELLATNGTPLAAFAKRARGVAGAVIKMLGRVYTFERDPSSVLFPTTELVSTAAVRAVVAAINDQPGIRYEELTDSDNAKPIIALLFADALRLQHFDGLIEATLKLCGVRVHVVHGPACPLDELHAAEPRGERARELETASQQAVTRAA